MMPWMIYLFGSGQAIFLAAGMILVAVALLPGKQGWRAKGLAILVWTGIAVAVLSAAPLSYLAYAVALGVTGAWLWWERRRAVKEPQTTRALRLATAAMWIGIILLELPYQFAPPLPPLGNPPLFVVGDSVTAGMGGGNDGTWTSLLPPEIAVHNLARPGATTATALQHQAPQIPAGAKLVLLEIGGNDLLGGTSAAQFEEDLEALCQEICGTANQTAAHRTVVMFELPLPPLANEYGRIQRRIAARYSIRLIPKRAFIGVLTGDGSTLDSIHLSEAGHRRMAELVANVIQPSIQPLP
jgi:acyl-CoA thioesterase-1